MMPLRAVSAWLPSYARPFDPNPLPAAGSRTVRFGDDLPSRTEKRLMRKALELSRQSKDPSSKVGAVIAGAGNRILAQDYNHFPPGLDEGPADRWERPAKYDWIGHAETNAIYAAAKKGVALDGSRIFINWFPCVPCTRAIISSGIQELVGFQPDYDHPRWGPDFRLAKKMLDEAKVRLKLFPETAFRKS